MSNQAPCYSELGKNARDIFDKDFQTGICNFDLKSKTCTGADVKLNGNHDLNSSLFQTSFEYKTKLTCGVLSKIKVDSKWSNTMEIEVSDRIIRNLKQTASLTILADEWLKKFSLKNCHNSSKHNFELDFHFSETCPTTVSSLVLGPIASSFPIYFGATATMEPRIPRPTKLAALAFSKYKDIQGLISINNQKIVDMHVFHSTSFADLGIKFTWNRAENTLKSNFGFLYKPSPATFIKAKIDNNVNIGVAYGVKISEGMNVILSTLIDGKSPQAGGHQMGFTIEAIA